MDSVYTVLFYMLLATVGVFIFSLISFTRIQKKRHYKCPECGHCFKPGGFVAFFSRRQNVTDRLLDCPRCGYRSYMENIDDSPEPQNEQQEKTDNPDLHE
ncbi:MAG: hypothetical protein WCP73_09985 [Eubacteriales bacterium]